VALAALILFFALYYRKGRLVDRTNPLINSRVLEAAWIGGPLFVFLGLFFWSAALYTFEQQAPSSAMEIYVVGKQWMWKVQHPEGRREINELHVPRGRPVKLWMTSEDVIHSFYVPAFRIKMDVLPGRYTTQWFQATRTGRYYLFCAEYCGTDHAVMGGFVEVMEPAEYARWLASGTAAGDVGESLPQGGQLLYTKLGCATCHGGNGEGGPRGPSLHNLLGREVRLDSGAVVVADENYLRESILDPMSKIVAGFPPLMPSFRGQLREEDLLRVIAFIKTLRETNEARDPRGAAQLGGSP
jgi:cytochrome c oxidase subunit 2